MTLTPAYGRDYTSKAKAEKDFRAGKDFIISDMFHQYDGKPVNITDLKATGCKTVNIRYKGLRSVAVIEV